MSRELPKIHQQAMRTWLKNRGIAPHAMTAAHKILWLDELRDSNNIRYATFYIFATYLEKFGTQHEPEKSENDNIVRQYALSLRHDESFLPPSGPGRPLPESLFVELLKSLDGERRLGVAANISRARLRTGYLLAWHTGIVCQTIVNIKRGQLRPSPDGYILTSEALTRTVHIPIRRQANTQLCAVAQLDRWFTYVAFEDPAALVLPAIHRRQRSYDCKSKASALPWTRHFLKFLTQIGRPNEYTIFSLRSAFLKRIRDTAGFSSAFYLSGYALPNQLIRVLGPEVDWGNVKAIW